MKALETIVDTTESRMISFELPLEIKPGKHKLVIVIYEDQFLEEQDSIESLNPKLQVEILDRKKEAIQELNNETLQDSDSVFKELDKTLAL